MAEGQALTHNELWDDSVLQDSWNEAVEEYNHYQSLFARGEQVEDVLREVDAEGVDAVVAKQAPIDAAIHNSVTHDAPEAAEAQVVEVNVTGTGNGEDQARTDASQNQTPAQNPIPNSSSTLPHALLATQDDEMKNLMMSWYYAGYYTGLREGQQQARQGGTK